ncbi:hypothetical protein ILUMI_22476 [Ignelater luminosus]|uniref:Uncharacterized protein n=1 Tax=Ignelater luminosus TaxID=2038154 RepID=A0A8K0G2V7_IGNLU|nr:hypothetical protein ILUMI_22476 [Ignelater luminosus]
MSFLEAIEGLMAKSGMEEALQTVYTENSVPHMLEGKAKSSALLGHFLISSAPTALSAADVLERRLAKLYFLWAFHFGSSEDVTKEDLVKIGCKVIVSLYGGNIDTSNLNVFRYEQHIKKIALAKKRIIDIARLPPTQNAAKYPLLRDPIDPWPVSMRLRDRNNEKKIIVLEFSYRPNVTGKWPFKCYCQRLTGSKFLNWNKKNFELKCEEFLDEIPLIA